MPQIAAVSPDDVQEMSDGGPVEAVPPVDVAPPVEDSLAKRHETWCVQKFSALRHSNKPSPISKRLSLAIFPGTLPDRYRHKRKCRMRHNGKRLSLMRKIEPFSPSVPVSRTTRSFSGLSVR